MSKLVTFLITFLMLCTWTCKAYKNAELTNQQINNLKAFSKTYGYVRYFHPSGQALKTDWNELLIRNVLRCTELNNKEDLIVFLDSIYSRIAPNVQFIKTGEKINDTSTIQGNIQYWEHNGLGLNYSMSAVYKSKLKKANINKIKTDLSVLYAKPFVSELVPGVTMVLPLIVQQKGNNQKLLTPKKITYSLSDKAVRLGGVIIAWNELQHFYPYWDVVNANWEQVLTNGLQNAYDNKTEEDFEETLNQMIIPLRDGHGTVTNHNNKLTWKTASIWVAYTEGKLVVKSCVDEALKKTSSGDEILSIDGVVALDLFKQKKEMFSGSKQWQKNCALETLFANTSNKDSIDLKLKNKDGIAYRIKVANTSGLWYKKPYRYKKVEEIEDGIYYVSLDRITTKDFKKELANLALAKGIIFELKVYPNIGILPLKHLTDKKMQSARWNIPKVYYPDQLHFTEFDTAGRWDIKPKKPFLGGKKIVFIISGRAISYAESYLGIVEHYQLGKIVGEEASAGANGNVNFIDLPGDVSIAYTGMKVLKHDSSQHHLIGIEPTHKVTTSIKAIREHRDELIEEALKIMQEENFLMQK